MALGYGLPPCNNNLSGIISSTTVQENRLSEPILHHSHLKVGISLVVEMSLAICKLLGFPLSGSTMPQTAQQQSSPAFRRSWWAPQLLARESQDCRGERSRQAQSPGPELCPRHRPVSAGLCMDRKVLKQRIGAGSLNFTSSYVFIYAALCAQMGLQVLLQDEHVFEGHKDNPDTVFHAEIGSSPVLSPVLVTP